MERKKRCLIAVMVVLGFVLLGHARAQDAAKEKLPPRTQAKMLVESAVGFIGDYGKDKAVEEINNPEGKFIVDEFYVYVYDLKGVVVAHPYRLSLRGKSVIQEKDSRGKLFRKEIIDKAKSQGEGWVEYRYKNPTTKKEKLKAVYFKRAGDWVVCCNAY